MEDLGPGNACWGDLPWPLLGQILQELSALLAAGPPLTVAEAAAVVDTCSPNRHWRDSAAAELRLAVRCSGGVGEVEQLFRLAQRCRLSALHFEQHSDDAQAAAAVSALLSHPVFDAAAGPHLRLLRGAPCSSAGGQGDSSAERRLHHFSIAAFRRLEELHLYVPPHQQVLSLRNSAWAAAQRLRRLEVCGRHYVALRLLPPLLEELLVSAWHILVEPSVLIQCPKVRLLAAAVLLSEHVLPYPQPAAGLEAAAAQLQQLAELVAAAGLPPGHSVRLDTNLVCFQRLNDGADIKLAAPPAAAADGGGHGAGWPELRAAAGGVAALLSPGGRCAWPAALGGTGPEISLELSGAPNTD